MHPWEIKTQNNELDLQGHLEKLRYDFLHFVRPPHPKPDPPTFQLDLPHLRIPLRAHTPEREPNLSHRKEEPEEEEKTSHKYKCDVCPMSFRWKSNLNRHVRKHTGAKPYECS